MSDSQPKRSFTIQVHPIIESVVIKDLDADTTSQQIKNKYAAIVARKYNSSESELLSSVQRVIPFTPVRPLASGACPDYYPWETADTF